MTDNKVATITHITMVGDKEVTYQLPVGTPKDLFDNLVARINEEVGAEAKGGRAGAETSLEIAITLQATNPELRDKTWKQLVQESAYSVPVTDAYATHGKSKGAYSNHRTELRESHDQLKAFAAGLEVVKRGLMTVDEIDQRWYQDPDRVKNGGGPRASKEVTFTAVGPVQDSELDGDDDQSTESVVGLMIALAGKHVTAGDLQPNPAEFLNQLRALGRWVDNAKAFVVSYNKLGA